MKRINVGDSSRGLAPPLQRGTLSDQVYEFLKEQILSHRLVEGTPLRANELSRQLRISITPVYHAINRLAGEGLVEQLPHRGAFVRRLSLETLIELMAVRRALEVLAGELLLEQPPVEREPKLAALRAVLDRAAAALAAKPPELARFIRLDRTFHMRLVQAAGNRTLRTLYEPVVGRTAVIQSTYTLRLEDPRVELTLAEHRAMLVALEASDLRRFEEAVRRHLDNVVDEARERWKDGMPVDDAEATS